MQFISKTIKKKDDNVFIFKLFLLYLLLVYRNIESKKKLFKIEKKLQITTQKY